MTETIVSGSQKPASEPVSQAPKLSSELDAAHLAMERLGVSVEASFGGRVMSGATSAELQEAVRTYTWAAIEAKNLLRCISIATDHGESVADDLRPAIGCAIDGVVRLLSYVERQFERVDTDVASDEPLEVDHAEAQ